MLPQHWSSLCPQAFRRRVARRAAFERGRPEVAVEIERRLLESAPGTSTFSDLEAWVPVETWHRALDLLHEASSLLHAGALPAGTPDTVHVSATSHAFTMAGGLTGEAVRWRP